MEDKEITKMWMLLDIVHKASAAGPSYGWIVSMANDEINTFKPEPPVVEPVVPEKSVIPSQDFQAFNRTRLNVAPSGQDTDNE